LNALPAFDMENLTPINRLNEYIMTALRTKEGLNLEFVSGEFGKNAVDTLEKIFPGTSKWLDYS
jgi:oxygen-independent coproporphyrinogen-3 oxidase